MKKRQSLNVQHSLPGLFEAPAAWTLNARGELLPVDAVEASELFARLEKEKRQRAERRARKGVVK